MVDRALVGAGSTTLVVDDEPDEVAPAPPAWSPRARVAAAVGVVLVLVTALLARPEPEVHYDARGYTARGDAARSGVVSLAPLEPPTRVAWSADVGAARSLSVVRLAGDLVLEQTGGGILAARDATTGELRWLRRDTATSLGAVRVGDVVAVPGELRVRGLSAVDGTELWELPGDPTELLTAGDLLLARSGDRLTAVEPGTGGGRWQLDAARALDASIQEVIPGGAGIGLWLTSPPGLPLDSPRVEHRTALLDPATGEVRFDIALPRPFAASPIAVGGRTVATADPAGIAVRTPGGREVRRIAVEPDTLAATGDVLAVSLVTGGVIGFDLRTGSRIWTRPDVVPARLVATDGLVLADTATLIDARTGRTLSRQPRLDIRAVVGEPSVLVLPSIAGTELELRDRRGTRVAAVPLLPDEAAAPAVGLNRVFVPTREGVEAYLVADGTRDWSFAQLPTGRTRGGGHPTARTPAVATSNVLVSPGDGLGGGPGLVALELSGGVRTWDRSGDAPIVRGPLTLAGDTAFVPVGAEVHGYEAATGRRAFAAVVGTTRGPLVVSPNRVVGGPAPSPRGEYGDEVVAILRRDRSESWRTRLSPCSGPVLAGERVAWGTATGVTALDETTGTPAWTFPTANPVCLDPVAAGGRLIVVEDPATLHALPAVAGGPPAWSTVLPSPPVASPVVAGEHLLVPLLDGTLAAYALAGGTPAWTFDLGGVADASPAVLDGHVLVHLRDGRLLALAP